MLQRAAPPLRVTRWLNAPQPLTLDGLRGKVVMLHAFQMRCPGCVEFATPQAQRVDDFFPRSDLTVIGLHTVFESHSTMSPDALGAYVAQTRLTFPIAVDEPDGSDGIPLTMRAYALDGTPSVVLIDRAGFIRLKRMGHVPDLELGASIATLVAERGHTMACAVGERSGRPDPG